MRTKKAKTSSEAAKILFIPRNISAKKQRIVRNNVASCETLASLRHRAVARHDVVAQRRDLQRFRPVPVRRPFTRDFLTVAFRVKMTTNRRDNAPRWADGARSALRPCVQCSV